MIRAIKITEYSLLAAIALIFLKRPLLFGSVEVKLSVFFFAFFAASLLFLLISVLKKEISFPANFKKLVIFFLGLFSTILLGTFLSLIIYKHLPLGVVLNEYAHVLTCFCIFLEIIL